MTSGSSRSTGVSAVTLANRWAGMGPELPPPVAEQVAEEMLGCLRPVGVQGLHLGIEFGVGLLGLQTGGPPPQVLRPQGDQPVPQRQCRSDIVVVVVGDAVEVGRVVVGHVLLVLDDRRRPLVDVVTPDRSRSPLEVLEPVGLGADLQGVADHRQQIDEEPGLDQGGQAPPPPPRGRR